MFKLLNKATTKRKPIVDEKGLLVEKSASSSLSNFQTKLAKHRVEGQSQLSPFIPDL